jgi:hypothetical protein
MAVRPLRYAYPLPDGGSEYTFGEYVWTVVPSHGGWEIAVEAWADDMGLPARVVAAGFPTAAAAQNALLSNQGRLYRADGSPTP